MFVKLCYNFLKYIYAIAQRRFLCDGIIIFYDNYILQKIMNIIVYMNVIRI